MIAPLLLVSEFPTVNPVAPTNVNVAPVPTVKFPLVDKLLPWLSKSMLPVPVDKLVVGNVNIPLEITVKG